MWVPKYRRERRALPGMEMMEQRLCLAWGFGTLNSGQTLQISRTANGDQLTGITKVGGTVWYTTDVAGPTNTFIAEAPISFIQVYGGDTLDDVLDFSGFGGFTRTSFKSRVR